MDQRIAALDKRLDDFIAATERNFEAVGKRLEAMDQRIAALDKRLDEFIAATQRRLDDFIAATQRNFQIAYNRLDSLQERHDLLGAGLSRLTGRVDNGLGAYYEFRAEKLVRGLAGRDLDLSRVRVLLGARTGFGNQFADLLEDAWRAGTRNPRPVHRSSSSWTWYSPPSATPTARLSTWPPKSPSPPATRI